MQNDSASFLKVYKNKGFLLSINYRYRNKKNNFSKTIFQNSLYLLSNTTSWKKFSTIQKSPFL